MSTTTTEHWYEVDVRAVLLAEREACASVVENMKMDAVLLAAGELGKSDRRLVKALLPWLANQIRNRNE